MKWRRHRHVTSPSIGVWAKQPTAANEALTQVPWVDVMQVMHCWHFFLCAGHCGIVLSHLEAIPIYSNHLWFRYHYACHPLMPVVLVMNCQTALQGLQASQNHNHSRGLKWSCSSAFSPLSSQATGQAFVASALWSSLEHIGPSLFVFSELFKRILMCLGRKFPKPKALTRSIISNAFFQTSC
jgi:hypothetical protein